MRHYTSELRFESAAKLQSEIEAVDWVLAEQKVALARPVNADICGWSAGRLVRFEMRGGRIAAWTGVACDAASAQPFLAATPRHWSAFAQRNADLAAALAPAS